MATKQEIEKKREELKKVGIAQFKIMIGNKELSEEESLARTIDESWSFFFVCVLDPYFNRGYSSKSGNLRFRLFQTLKDKPTIPFGYIGMPSFSFEDYTGNPQKKAVEILKTKLKNNRYTFRVDGEHIVCKRIKTEEEKKEKKQQEEAEREKYTIKEGDTPEVREIKEKIKKLEETKALYKEINRRIRKGQSLEGLGLSEGTIKKLLTPDFLGRVGIPGYELTSLNGKIKRLKAKIK